MHDFDEDKQNKQLADLKRKEEEDLVSMLAETKYNLPYADLYRVGIDNEALRAIDERDAHERGVAPFKIIGKKIYIALRTPTEELKKELIEDMKRKELEPVFYMTSLGSIEKVWDRYKELSMAENSKIGGIDISSEILRDTAKNIKRMQDIKTALNEEMESGKTHKITRLLEIILAGAIAINASDIHIKPEENGVKLRLRLDGVLQDIEFFSTNIYHLLNSRIKLLSGMKLTSLGAQDGRFSIMEDESEISIRTSLIPGSYGETIVMRILDPKSIQINIEDMGMDSYLYDIVLKEIAKPNGLILVTGPTGSGKTTTLYAFLRKIYSSEINIITIEDPVEYRLKGITQTQISDAKEYGFAEGLKAALRQDPDVIMVGEIRDSETAKTAVQSALTGHLVFSTLHTNNASVIDEGMEGGYGGESGDPEFAAEGMQGQYTEDDPVEQRFQTIETALADIGKALHTLTQQMGAQVAHEQSEGDLPPDAQADLSQDNQLENGGLPDGPEPDLSDSSMDEALNAELGEGMEVKDEALENNSMVKPDKVDCKMGKTGDKAAKFRDSSPLEAAYKETLALAEILVPGFRMSTFDRAAPIGKTYDSICSARRKCLDAAYATAAGKAVIDSVNTAKTYDTSVLGCAAVRSLFVAAAGAKKLMNNAAMTKDSRVPVIAGAGSSTPGAVSSIEDLNALNRQFYASKKKPV